MLKPAIPIDEDERLSTLNSLGLLDSPADERFDRFTRIAEYLFDVPIALISLVDYDRQWFKSCRGLSASETPRDISFCGHAINETEPFVIEDTLADPRFADNPLVTAEPKIRFYAGYPLRAPNGKKLGTLCIISDRPRTFTGLARGLLVDLGMLLEMEIHLLHSDTVDLLTGLYNEYGFRNTVERSLIQCQKLQRPLGMIYLDMDNFETLNAQHGHSLGDKALLEFSELVAQAFYGASSMARLENDTFAVLIDSSMLDKIHQPMQRLVESVAIRNKTLRRGYTLAFSMGFVKYDADKHHSVDNLISDANNAMLENKKSKRR